MIQRLASIAPVQPSNGPALAVGRMAAFNSQSSAPVAPAASSLVLPQPFAQNALQAQSSRQVRAASAAGIYAMTTWLSSHPTPGDAELGEFAQGIAAPPDAAGQAAELAFLHQVKAIRTAAENTSALFYSKHGRYDIWTQLAADWARTVPANVAKRGLDLLARATDLNDRLNASLKDSYARPHPYETDPTLDPVKRGANTNHEGKHSYSYPSSHSSGAFVGATILSSLMPARTAEFQALADQVTYSRVYAAVHYPSDDAAGAWLGSAMATYVLATSSA